MQKLGGHVVAVRNLGRWGGGRGVVNGRVGDLKTSAITITICGVLLNFRIVEDSKMGFRGGGTGAATKLLTARVECLVYDSFPRIPNKLNSQKPRYAPSDRERNPCRAAKGS